MKTKGLLFSALICSSFFTFSNADTTLAVRALPIPTSPGTTGITLDHRIQEANRTYEIFIDRTEELRGDVTVDYVVRSSGFFSNATPGHDFILSSGKATLKSGVKEFAIPIQLLDDKLIEAQVELFSVMIENGVAADPARTGRVKLSANNRAIIEIVDNERPLGDIDGDCIVGIADLNKLRNFIGASQYPNEVDLDGFGGVTVEDLNILRNNFGRTCPKL